MLDPVSESRKVQPNVGGPIRWISRVVCKHPTATSVFTFFLILLLCFARWYPAYQGPTHLDSQGLLLKSGFSFSTLELWLLFVAFSPWLFGYMLSAFWIIAMLAGWSSLIFQMLRWGIYCPVLEPEREFNFIRDQRIFAEWQRISSLQGWVIGFLALTAPMYLSRIKPQGWKIWLFSSVGAVVAYLLAMVTIWQPSMLVLMFGILWGIATGYGVMKVYSIPLRLGSS